MSKRSNIDKKKRRLIRSLRNTPPAYIDLVEHIRMRTRCTAGMAREVIMSGSIMVDSHPVGFKWEGDGGDVRKVFYPYVPANKRGSIVIVNKVGKDA